MLRCSAAAVHRGLPFIVPVKLSGLCCPLWRTCLIHQTSGVLSTYTEHNIHGCMWIASNFFRKERVFLVLFDVQLIQQSHISLGLIYVSSH